MLDVYNNRPTIKWTTYIHTLYLVFDKDGPFRSMGKDWNTEK